MTKPIKQSIKQEAHHRGRDRPDSECGLFLAFQYFALLNIHWLILNPTVSLLFKKGELYQLATPNFLFVPTASASILASLIAVFS